VCLLAEVEAQTSGTSLLSLSLPANTKRACFHPRCTLASTLAGVTRTTFASGSGLAASADGAGLTLRSASMADVEPVAQHLSSSLRGPATCGNTSPTSVITLLDRRALSSRPFREERAVPPARGAIRLNQPNPTSGSAGGALGPFGPRRHALRESERHPPEATFSTLASTPERGVRRLGSKVGELLPHVLRSHFTVAAISCLRSCSIRLQR